MKKFSSRFSMATHILAMIAHFQSVTSEQMAVSIGTNPVVVRRIIGQLKKAGLVNVKAGVGGSTLIKSPVDITLLDIYRAVEVAEENELFRIHDGPDPECPIGAYIETSLRKMMLEAQAVMEGKLASVTLAELTDELLQEAANKDVHALPLRQEVSEEEQSLIIVEADSGAVCKDGFCV